MPFGDCRGPRGAGARRGRKWGMYGYPPEYGGPYYPPRQGGYGYYSDFQYSQYGYGRSFLGRLFGRIFRGYGAQRRGYGRGGRGYGRW